MAQPRRTEPAPNPPTHPPTHCPTAHIDPKITTIRMAVARARSWPVGEPQTALVAPTAQLRPLEPALQHHSHPPTAPQNTNQLQRSGYCKQELAQCPLRRQEHARCAVGATSPSGTHPTNPIHPTPHPPLRDQAACGYSKIDTLSVSCLHCARLLERIDAAPRRCRRLNNTHPHPHPHPPPTQHTPTTTHSLVHTPHPRAKPHPALSPSAPPGMPV